jgi:Chromo (CHRromatin Organisation MOdifier) domain
MQSLAQMLAMVVDSASADWHQWLSHVAFSHNTSHNRATGATPFLLVMGREARYAFHVLAGRERVGVATDSTPAGVRQLITDLLTRQRLAQSVADRRHDLRKAQVLQSNHLLADAMGLRQVFEVGTLVWYYNQARQTHATTQGGTDNAANKVVYSRKFLDRWSGPYRVLDIGPCGTGSDRVQANCLRIDMQGRRLIVSVHLCKKCRDPLTSKFKPDTLPTGFSRYLLAKFWHGLTPGSVTVEDAVNVTTERHGVEAILNHRLTEGARGRSRGLQYLVRWEGGRGLEEVADSWEPAHHLDASRSALSEYWSVVDRASAGGAEVQGAATQVVRTQLRKVAKERGVGGQKATGGRGAYTLPATAVVLERPPAAAQLKGELVVGLSILAVFSFVTGGVSHLEWCEGQITASPTTRKKYSPKHAVYWFDDAKYLNQLLSLKLYSTDPDAVEGAWFLFGDTINTAPFLPA